LGRRLGIWTLRSPRPHVTEANVPHDWPAKHFRVRKQQHCRQIIGGRRFVVSFHVHTRRSRFDARGGTGRTGKTRWLLQSVIRAVNRDTTPRLASPRGRIRTVALLWQYSIRKASLPISNAVGNQPLNSRSSGLESGAAACAFHKGKPKRRPLSPEMIFQTKLTTCSNSRLEQALRHRGEACDESWGEALLA
jgi:hypothetical protein